MQKWERPKVKGITSKHGALAIIDQNGQNFEGGVVIRLEVNFFHYFCMNILVIHNTIL